MARNSFESLSCYPAKQMKPDILHHVVYIVMTIHQEEASSNVFWLSKCKNNYGNKKPISISKANSRSKYFVEQNKDGEILIHSWKHNSSSKTKATNKFSKIQLTIILE